MRLAYDNIVFSLQAAGGISMYWSALIRNLVHTDARVAFYESANSNVFARGLPIQAQTESRIPVPLLRYLPFTRWLREGTIFHSSYYRVALQRGVRNVVTVHDFTYERLATGARRHVHALQKRLALRNADGVICVSEKTREDLEVFYPRIRAPIAVIPNGVSEGFRPLSWKPSDAPRTCDELHGRPFVLFVGGRTHYKNFNIAVETVASIDDRLCLVLVGGGPLSETHSRLLESRLPGRHVHSVDISESTLNTLYNLAHCLLYPSSYEGFGLPLLEAMAAGCPVVALRAASIPEVVGDAALLAERPNAADFGAKVRALQNTLLRDELVAKGFARARLFSWPACFQRTYEFYESVAGRDTE